MPSPEEIEKILSLLNGARSKSEKKRIAVQSGLDLGEVAIAEAETPNRMFTAEHFPSEKSEPKKEPKMKNHGGRYVPQEILFPLYAKWAAAEKLSEQDCRKELAEKGYNLSNTAFRRLLERMHLVDKLIDARKHNPGRALNTMVMRNEIDKLTAQVEQLFAALAVHVARLDKHSKLIEKRRIENKSTRSELQMLRNAMSEPVDLATGKPESAPACSVPTVIYTEGRARGSGEFPLD